jgi:CubicO group peptidase (beta-lactamase class C family)
MESLGIVRDWPVNSAGAVALVAGPPDAGPPDAGPPDAGPPDAGPPDAGPPDAGPPDAGFRLTGTSGVEIVSTVGETASVFAWASVTKLCTALALAVAAEEGTLSFDDEAGPPGSTVAHLLAHASGLGPTAGPPLMAPARRRIYSNHGYELLGDHLAARSGIPFVDYVREAVLEPLAMSGARWDPSGSPASGLGGTVLDLAALARELLRPRLVSPVTLARMTGIAFAGLDGVLPGFGVQRPCDWGLGPEVRGTKRPHWTGSRNDPATFGHFGLAGGFLWVDPVAGVALGALSDRPFASWAAAAWPSLSDAVLDEVARM